MEKSYLVKLAKTAKEEVEGKCPWVSELSPEQMLNEMEEELKELREALKNGRKEEIKEETGDVIRDALLLLYVVSKAYALKPSEVVKRVWKKIKWRKPWLFSGKKISKEEAVKIWFARKRQEKRKS